MKCDSGFALTLSELNFLSNLSKTHALFDLDSLQDALGFTIARKSLANRPCLGSKMDSVGSYDDVAFLPS